MYIPEERGPLPLTAVPDSGTGRNAFAYNRRTVPPLIRVSPGSVITRYLAIGLAALEYSE